MNVFQVVRRDNLHLYHVDQIGWGHQGSIHKISVDGQTAAVKDIRGRGLPYRLLVGRWLLAREFRVYVRLQGLPGIPRLFHRIDSDGFIFEYVEGEPLSSFAKDAPLPPSFFDALARLIDAIHCKGVVHSDLKHKKNILVGPDYQPYLVDFGASWMAPSEGNFLKRWLYRQFEQIDRAAVSKIRTRFATGNPTTTDREILSHRNVMERCSDLYQWFYRFFSRKHRWKRRPRI